MIDQAENLRRMVKKKIKIITITSGKGGVGKSNFVVNFGLALQKKGKKVLIFDADIGMGNDDILMGIYPKYNIFDVIKGINIEDIIVKGINGISLISAGSGINIIEDLTEEERRTFLEGIISLNEYDYILIDTGAGINRSVLAFISSCDEVIVVTTPDPTSITDAYSLLKAINHFKIKKEVNVVVNMTLDNCEGKVTFDRLNVATTRFLNINLNYMGQIPDDLKLVQSVRAQNPFIILYPKSKASKAIEVIVHRFTNNQEKPESTAKLLFSKLFNIF